MELAERIGVSYQQVQKYENDRSQITLQRLYIIAGALQTSVLSFLTDRNVARLSEKSAPYRPGAGPGGFISKEERRFLQLFSGIRSPKVKRGILGLLESIVEQQGQR